jgi:hypothetical protein
MSNVMLIPLKNPGYLKISNFLGDLITLPTSQKRVYGHFRASFFDRFIITIFQEGFSPESNVKIHPFGMAMFNC